VKLSAVSTNERRLFQTVETQHENRRAATFVDEDTVDMTTFTYSYVKILSHTHERKYKSDRNQRSTSTQI